MTGTNTPKLSVSSNFLHLVEQQIANTHAGPKAEELVAEAEKAEKEGNREKASEFYMSVLSI